jgi:hypothetical protein
MACLRLSEEFSLSLASQQMLDDRLVDWVHLWLGGYDIFDLQQWELIGVRY